MTHLLLAAGAVDPARVKPGWLGLLVVLAIAVAVVVLWRSMNRQLKKVDFDEAAADGDGPGAETDHEADKPS